MDTLSNIEASLLYFFINPDIIKFVTPEQVPSLFPAETVVLESLPYHLVYLHMW